LLSLLSHPDYLVRWFHFYLYFLFCICFCIFYRIVYFSTLDCPLCYFSYPISPFRVLCHRCHYLLLIMICICHFIVKKYNSTLRNKKKYLIFFSTIGVSKIVFKSTVLYDQALSSKFGTSKKIPVRERLYKTILHRLIWGIIFFSFRG
jgi:hypothetical protein